MALTRSQTPPSPSQVDSASLERESPIRIVPASPKDLSGSNGLADGATTLVTNEPTTRTGRLSKQISGVVDDVKEIAGLRLALVKAEVSEQVNFRVGKAKQGSVAGAIALLGSFFLLVTIGLGLGWLLGHMFWGFLIVTAALFAGCGIAWLALKPKPPTT